MRILSTTILAILLLLVLQPCKARRILYQDQENKAMVKKGGNLLLGSLQKGTVPPSEPSGCTNIPGTAGPICPTVVQEMNFAGDVPLPRASVYPRLVVPSGVATNQR